MPDQYAVLAYITKYVSKAERPSVTFPDVMRAVCEQLDTATSAQVVFQKMLGKLISERDWSAQEVCHCLMDCKMFSSSREFIPLALDTQTQRRIVAPQNPDINADDVEESSWKDQYYRRPEGAELMEYLCTNGSRFSAGATNGRRIRCYAKERRIGLSVYGRFTTPATPTRRLTSSGVVPRSSCITPTATLPRST
jgi:hypothetical protein